MARLGSGISALRLIDGSQEKGEVQILFHHPENDDGRISFALKAAVEAFNRSWVYYNSLPPKSDDEDNAIIHEIRIG